MKISSLYFYIIASTEWVGAAFSLSDGVGLRTLPSQPILVVAVSVGTSNEKKGIFKQIGIDVSVYIVKLCDVPASRNGAYRSPKRFSIGLSPKLVNPLDFHQLR